MKPSSIQIIKDLHAKGYQALWAGGCVRDMLLGVEPKDFDIVTDATPEVVESLFDKTIPIGKQFGIIKVIYNEHEFEIATFRKESDYKDGRRPSIVEFTDAYEDAHRRDFTINGMFYNPITDEVTDHVNGQRDLDLKVLEFIGDPNQRIQEDHLRILRAIRFKNTYGLTYNPSSYQALLKNANLVTKITPERVQVEINKMLSHSSRVGSINNMEDLGILEHLLPEIQNLKGVGQSPTTHAEGDVYAHTLECLKQVKDQSKLSVIWATFLHDVGKSITYTIQEDKITFPGHASASAELAKQILTRLRFPKKFIQHVEWLCAHHMSLYQIFDMTVSRQKHWFLHPWFLDLLEVHKYDTMGQQPQDLSRYHELHDLYSKTVSKIKVLPKPFLDGSQITKLLSIKPGPQVGVIKSELYDLQLDGVFKSKKEAQSYLLKNFSS
ncbi:CCA tRNA nucleotidyltransferase [bacterium]|jgi:poly(A) polymerase|nr:CCA tRNA nucleotidyltransferase [bacterium]